EMGRLRLAGRVETLLAVREARRDSLREPVTAGSRKKARAKIGHSRVGFEVVSVGGVGSGRDQSVSEGLHQKIGSLAISDRSSRERNVIDAFPDVVGLYLPPRTVEDRAGNEGKEMATLVSGLRGVRIPRVRSLRLCAPELREAQRSADSVGLRVHRSGD